jgi:hypothetical protein
MLFIIANEFNEYFLCLKSADFDFTSSFYNKTNITNTTKVFVEHSLSHTHGMSILKDERRKKRDRKEKSNRNVRIALRNLLV